MGIDRRGRTALILECRCSETCSKTSSRASSEVPIPRYQEVFSPSVLRGHSCPPTRTSEYGAKVTEFMRDRLTRILEAFLRHSLPGGNLFILHELMRS